MGVKMGRRLFAKALAGAPVAAGAAGTVAANMIAEKAGALGTLMASGGSVGVAVPCSTPENIWSHDHPILGPLNRRHDGIGVKQDVARNLALRSAAGALDADIQALTSCSPVYRQHLQMMKDQAREQERQDLWKEIGRLRALLGSG